MNISGAALGLCTQVHDAGQGGEGEKMNLVEWKVIGKISRNQVGTLKRPEDNPPEEGKKYVLGRRVITVVEVDESTQTIKVTFAQ